MVASKSKRTIFRGIVGVIGLNLLLIGLGFLVAPSTLSSQFWIHPSSIAGFATLRGDLGGLFIGMAVFTLLGARPSKSRWLIVPTVFLAAIILGRLVNLFSEGVSGPSVGPLLLEIVLVIVLIGAQKTLLPTEENPEEGC